ncbi:MAG: hypothetical protein H7Y88_01820 [Phycisphaerales bacterium]|nr:hypothetical protein [Phycisphaerales bacterium]
MRASRRRAARAFTLIEAALTTVIIGVGVLALIEAQQTFMRANDWSTQAATATYLASEIREMTRTLPRHDPVTGLYTADDGNGAVLHGWGREPGETTLADLDDLDDYDGLILRPTGTADIEDGDLPGPVDAFGNVIPEIRADGTALLDTDGFPLPLQGWSQRITVEKIDPFNTGLVRSKGYLVPAVPPDYDGLTVDQFPMRITVETFFQGIFDSEPHSMTRVVWIVPQ